MKAQFSEHDIFQGALDDLAALKDSEDVASYRAKVFYTFEINMRISFHSHMF